MSYQPPNYPNQQQSPPGYQQYSQYQQPPQYPPPKRPSETAQFIALVRKHPIILIPIGVIGLIVVITAISATISSVGNSQHDASTATAQALVPTATPAPVATATPVPTVAPTKAPVPPVAIVPTHGTPHLGGNVSDFLGKYGHTLHPPSDGSSPSNRPSMSVGWFTDANGNYLLGVQYYADTHLVYYISYSGPSNWSKSQYRDYLIANFAPPGTAINAQANQAWASTGGDPYNPIAYDSSIGKFFLHISDGIGTMNTI